MEEKICADNSKTTVIQSANMKPASHRNFALRVWSLLALLTTGCGGPRTDGGVHAATPATKSTAAANGGPSSAAGTANDATPTAGVATPADIARVQAAVSALRGLPFRVAVPSTPQSRDQFRQFVREDLSRELGPQKNAALSKALAHTGFLPRPLDFAATMEEAETTQVAAYYDPRSGRFHTVAASANNDERDGVVAHELTHALQHQHFDLIAYDGGPDNAQHLSDDERAARRYVVEGEATFVMLAYQAASGSGAERHLGPLQVAGVRMTLTMLSAVDYTDVLALVRTGEEADKLDAEAKQSLDALARLPPLVALSMVDPYIRGAFLVSEAWARGGWPRVARLYHEPPQSTEQVLHPIEKLFDRRDPPIQSTCRRRLGGGARGAHRRRRATAARGGRRARLAVLLQDLGRSRPRGRRRRLGRRSGDGLGPRGKGGGRDRHPLGHAADAAEFEGAYRLSLSQRFERRPAKRSELSTAITRVTTTAPVHEGDGQMRWTIRRPDGTMVVVRRRGLDVDILDGAQPDEVEPLLAMLRAAERRIARR